MEIDFIDTITHSYMTHLSLTLDSCIMERELKCYLHLILFKEKLQLSKNQNKADQS